MRDNREDICVMLRFLGTALLLSGLAGALFGCSRNSYTASSAITDSVLISHGEYLDRLERLVINSDRQGERVKETYIRDSVIIVLNEAGEQINREVIRITDRSVDTREVAKIVQWKVDSTLAARNDVLTEYQKEDVKVEVGRKLTWWEEFQLESFKWAFGIAILCLLLLVGKPILKKIRFLS